jgi:alpha-N-acetylglucosamine transferase
VSNLSKSQHQTPIKKYVFIMVTVGYYYYYYVFSHELIVNFHWILVKELHSHEETKAHFGNTLLRLTIVTIQKIQNLKKNFNIQ